MTIPSLACVSIFCIGVSIAAQDASPTAFACNPKAIGAADRPRYNNLTKRLRSAVLGLSELTDGYALKLNGKSITGPEVAEWISMERLCCPFLTFELSTSGSQVGWLLKLTGPEGVKPLLQAEFSGR